MNDLDTPKVDPAEVSRQYVAAADTLGRFGRGASKLFMLKMALDLHADPAIMRKLYGIAMELGAYEDAIEVVRQIEPFLTSSEKDQRWLRIARRKLWNRPLVPEGIEPRLQPRAPRMDSPVQGRICYVLHNALPFASGGYATRAQGLAKGLQAQGFEVIGITRPGFPVDTTEIRKEDVPETSTTDGISYRHLVSPSRKDVRGEEYVFQSSKVLKALFQELRPALVLAASNHLTSLPAQLAARALGIPFIYEVRGFWEVTRLSREPSFEESVSYAQLSRLEALSATYADHVFTLTAPMQNELVARGVPEQMISLLPNSCDPLHFVPQERDTELASLLGIPPDVPVIGYIGSFVQYEGLDDLARACAMLARRGLDFRLLLVGSENVSTNAKGPVTALIEEAAADEALANRLIMPGRIPHDQVAAHYSLIDIAPFPRKPQPVTEMVSPMKPLEAYAMGKAVVASSVQALAEMVQHNQTGMLFEKGNVEALANVLQELILRPELRQSLAAEGRKWVLQERTWERTAAQAREVFAHFGVMP